MLLFEFDNMIVTICIDIRQRVKKYFIPQKTKMDIQSLYKSEKNYFISQKNRNELV